ncbi:uncharacterized protein (TIGR02594 family) [Sphingomonas vulcanisoli]|uniref:Uncharacterized protein (TIGR02594 family) n=1 Tax=Sphingomonas vulcanisoli TaxID=1658060 RepID=A0ABX0TUA0_9SPHN|nr:TIGR02594 family protein [Sphingomonas vulcanisoli]NIJ09092.1 uncharacterized protein (TIGR02594 family) [Sphingomonas vulcanisoli]
MSHTPLPAAYAWLGQIAAPPRMIAEALALYGTTEAPSPVDNPVILGWAKEIGAGAYRADAMPWCGLFMGVVAKRAGKPLPVGGPLWALNWRHFGTPADHPALGDTLVFQRPTGGHVGLYVGEDAGAFHVLGGNQGDRVCIVRVGRARLVAARRPAYTAVPASVRPIMLAAGGAGSANEA